MTANQKKGEQVILAEGSQGTIIADVKLLWVIERRDGLPGKEFRTYLSHRKKNPALE